LRTNNDRLIELPTIAKTAPITWAIITGEYPPQPGGVSDYSWHVAHALHAAGDHVHVFAPGRDIAELSSPVTVHRLSDRFGRRGRLELFEALNALPTPRRALLQFVLQSFGMRALNLPFAHFLARLRGFPLWIMFHEYAIGDDRAQPLYRRLHASVTRIVARTATRAADLAFVSTPAWRVPVSKASPALPIQWLPIPSNIPTVADLGEVERLRAQYQYATNSAIIGHFGTYRMQESNALILETIRLLSRSDVTRSFLLLGRGSVDFVQRLLADEPSLGGRVFGTGDLGAQEVANHLMACDLLVQPYSDGVTTRRSSLISGLALGVPTLTTLGSRSEEFWGQSGAALFAKANDVSSMVALAEIALADENIRVELREKARELYARLFDIAHTIRKLRQAGN
jgi:glycosyltransferase involved in cell wall biosynthesis